MDMDHYILRVLEGDFLWDDQSPPVNESAFVPFENRPSSGEDGIDKLLPSCVTGPMNMNKRMLRFLRKSGAPPTARVETGHNGRERCFRHMINERMRRDRQKQGYLALHSMLPMGTKSDKNWIVQMTAMSIQELQKYKEELRKRNMELEAILVANYNEKEGVKWKKIRLRVASPSSGVDSILEVLRCLKYLGLKTRNVHSHFSAQEFSAELEIETKVGAAEIEEAMQETVYEAERKLRL